MTYLDIAHEKIVGPEALAPLINIWRFRDKKIVFTNGCFDLLHQGHIDYLSKAADMGKLVVGLNSDSSVKMLNKGEQRPLQDENSRALILASLHCVSLVVIFHEETPYELIKKVQPDILVKGGDYAIEQIAGHDIVQQRGGKVMTIDLVPGYSTSAIEKKIRGLE